MTDIAALGLKVTSNGIVKTTSELDKFAMSAKKAGQAASKPINIKATGPSSKALGELRAMEKALASVRSAARVGVNTKVTQTGAQSVIASLNAVTAAANKARSAGGVTARVSGGGSAPTAGDIGATKGMTGAVLGLVAAYVSLQSIISGGKLYASLVDESKMLTAQLKLATSETGSFVQAQKDVRAIAAETRGDLGATATLYGKLMLNSRELGITQVEAARATETVTKAFKISGSNAVETAQGTRQLVQALQSGVLRGDEFNTMSESAPRLQKLLADSLGVTTGALREMAANGELTSEKLTRAFTDKKFTESLDKEFEQLPVTFDDAMGQIYNAAVLTFGAFDEGGEFSKSITQFMIGGSQGMADMEVSARSLGMTTRAELAGMISGFEKFGAAIQTAGEKALAVVSTIVPGFRDMYLIIEQIGSSSWGAGFIGYLKQALEFLNPLMAALKAIRGLGSDARNEVENSQKKQAWRDPNNWFGGAGQNTPGAWWNEDEKGALAVTAATGKATKAKKEHASAAENLAKRLENERKATEALITGLYESAAAYAKNTAEGKKAEIVAEAVARGMKKGAEANTYAALQLRKYVAEQIRSQAESISQMSEQTDAQAQVNKAVAAGALRAEDAANALSMLNEQRTLLNAIELAKDDPKALAAAKVALEALTAEQIRANAERVKANDLAAAAQTNLNIDAIRKETALQKQVGEDRLKALTSLSGDPLEDALARINNEYEKQSIILEYNAKIAQAAADKHFELAKALEREKQAMLAQVGQQQGQDTTEADMKRNRAYAIAAAHDVADIIGGGIGRAANVLLNVVKEIDDTLFDTTTQMGKVFLAFSQGAAIGGSVGGFTGSSQGGAIGGGLGGAAFEKFAGEGLKKALGAFGGPLASIAGGLLGGLIGGLLKKTPKASATISIIAGEAMDTAITGNKAKLKAAAGQMANSVISGLSDLATALGAELTGNAKVSIGIRKGNYRVDPTGAGRTKGAGVIDFGEDQAAAIAYALQDAIKDGVLSGLGESLNNLIKGDGDLQKQLEKALSFKSVFDDLQRMQDPQAFDLASLDKWRAGMDKIFAEAGATAEELAKLEELTGLKRAEIVKKYATDYTETIQGVYDQLANLKDPTAFDLATLEKWRQEMVATFEKGGGDLVKLEELYQLKRGEIVEQASSRFLELEREYRELEIQIMELEGKSVEALAATRALEKAAADESLRPLYDRIYQLRDEAAQVEKANAVAEERKGLENTLLQLQGNTVELRRLEREAINPLNRDIYDMIQAMTDWAAQVEKSKGLFASQTGIESEILGLKGQVTGDPVYAARALQLVREQELRTAEASLRPFLLLKYAMEDQVAEADKLAEAEQKLADSRKAIGDEMASLQRQWLEATGDTQGIRALDLAALLSDDARALQQKIWDYTDAKDRQAAADEAAAKAADDAAKAAQDYADALASAQDVLRQAFDRQVGALQETIEKFGGLADAISEFNRGLFISDTNPNQAFAQTQSQFRSTARMAGMGNEKALGAFTGDAQAYLDAAKNSVGSLAEYQAIVAQVSRASNVAERSARGMVSEAQAQIDLLTTQVSQFIDLNENIVSVHDAIVALQQLQASGTPVITDAITSSMGQVVQAVNESSENSSDDTKDLKAQVGQLTSAMEELVRRFKLVTPGVNFINVGGASDGSVPAIPIVDVTP